MLWKSIERAKLHDSGGRVSVYAYCLDKRGRIVSHAGNSYTKSSVVQKRISEKLGFPEKCFLHAELNAILRARGAAISTLVVARVDKQGNVKDGKPCCVCSSYIRLQEEIQGSKIDVIYSKENGNEFY